MRHFFVFHPVAILAQACSSSQSFEVIIAPLSYIAGVPLGCRIVFRPTVAAAAGGKSFDLLGVPLAALGMSSGGISTVDRYLPESCRSYCMHRMRLLADQARGNDLARWQRLASVLGREPLIWEYVEHKLRSILTGKRTVGSAGWAFPTDKK